METFYDKEKFDNGYDPLWTDVLAKHDEKPFHCLVGGGDQVRGPCPSLPHTPSFILPPLPLLLDAADFFSLDALAVCGLAHV